LRGLLHKIKPAREPGTARVPVRIQRLAAELVNPRLLPLIKGTATTTCPSRASIEFVLVASPSPLFEHRPDHFVGFEICDGQVNCTFRAGIHFRIPSKEDPANDRGYPSGEPASKRSQVVTDPMLSRVEVLVNGLLAPRLFLHFYRRYADSLELAGNEAFLEIGCGSGGVSTHLARRLRRGGSLTCIDISPQMLRIARRRLRRHRHVVCRLGSLDSLSFPPGVFGGCVIHLVLHEIAPSQRASTLQAMAVALEPSARVFVREPTDLHDGMPADEIRRLFRATGFREARAREYRVVPAGHVYEAVYVRTNPRSAAAQPEFESGLSVAK